VAADPVTGGQVAVPPVAELVTDKGYHSNQTMVDCREAGIRSYVSEPERGRRDWEGQEPEREAVYGNRRRIRGVRGKRLLRRRGELLERSFAHCYETGGLRRTHLRGHPNILKRVLLHVAGFNLSLVLRQVLGVGTPRGLQGRAAALLGLFRNLLSVLGSYGDRLRPWARRPSLPNAFCRLAPAA